MRARWTHTRGARRGGTRVGRHGEPDRDAVLAERPVLADRAGTRPRQHSSAIAPQPDPVSGAAPMTVAVAESSATVSPLHAALERVLLAALEGPPAGETPKPLGRAQVTAQPDRSSPAGRRVRCTATTGDWIGAGITRRAAHGDAVSAAVRRPNPHDRGASSSGSRVWRKIEHGRRLKAIETRRGVGQRAPVSPGRRWRRSRYPRGTGGRRNLPIHAGRCRTRIPTRKQGLWLSAPGPTTSGLPW